MAIPDVPNLTLPLLRLASKGEFQTAEAIDSLAQEFALTTDEREEFIPSGGRTRFAYRVHWATAHLNRAGLITRRGRGSYGITELGRSVLAHPPDRINLAYLSQFTATRETNDGLARSGKSEPESAIIPTLTRDAPQERIDVAIEELNKVLRVELLRRLRSIRPEAFEKLILDLMRGMGYGKDGSVQHLGRTSDGGVDGVINEDALGLERIYLQAKRYALGNGVGVEKVREFAGALDERGAAKGVLITTSHFAAQAHQYAKRSPKRLILIDGEELAKFLVQYGVAVRTVQTYEIKRLDEDYLNELES
jgi:restriction system protein